MKHLFTAVSLGISMTVSAHAALNPGDVLFTGQLSNGISVIDDGSAIDLWVNPESSARMATIVQGPDGAYYISDGRFPGNTASGILRIDDLFGAPDVSTFATGDPFMNPIGLVYDAPSQTFLSVNNPAGGGTQGVNEGIIATNASNGASSLVYQEPDPATDTPRFNAGNRITAAPVGGGYFVSSLNGGIDNSGLGGFDSQASALYAMREVDGAWVMDAAPAVDFSASVTGLGSDYTNIRGMAAVDGQSSMWVTDHLAGVLLRVDFDSEGQYLGMVEVLTGLLQPESIVYNEYTGKLIIAERGDLTDARISSVNLDGSGYEVLYEGDHARGLYVVIPAPAGLAALGLAGIMGRRRRR